MNYLLIVISLVVIILFNYWGIEIIRWYLKKFPVVGIWLFLCLARLDYFVADKLINM